MAKVASINQKEMQDKLRFVSPVLWALDNGLQLQAGAFKIEGREYQIDIINDDAPSIASKKGAQLGITEGLGVIPTLHHQNYGIYPSGALYLMPTGDDVSDFSKTRFKPLINKNPFLQRIVKDTDAANVKNINGSMLFLRGGRSSGRIDGLKETSSRLKSIPVDCVVIDERDEISDTMVAMAIERMGASSIKHYREFSTPSVPGFGIDVTYEGSDQRLWMIKCKHCGMETCLEKEFPECLGTYLNKQVFRKCKKCHRAIDPSNGRWVASYPARSIHGYWISQVSSKTVDPKTILDAYLFPERQIPKTTKTEVMNSRLGMAYIESENQLTEHQVKNCMSTNPMEGRHEGPCAMGVDIGALFHVVIGIKLEGRFVRILRIAEVPEFNDVHDLARDYNVRCAVFDKYPETHKVREFIKAEPFDGYLCEYSENLATSAVWDIDESQVRVNRTEILDKSHRMIADREIEFPRMSETMEIFIKHVISNVKKLDKKKSTGTPIYRYIQRGDDHFRHALNYFLLASTRVNEYRKSYFRGNRPDYAETSASYLRI